MTLIRHARRAFTVAALAGAALLAGCASLHTVSSSVATYGQWPAGMAPGTYSFDRLPSQQANLARQQSLESAAAQALAGAGFRPAAAGEKGSVTVQLGARIERFEADPWDDPFWGGGWRHRFGYPGWYGPYGPGPGPWGWGRRGFWGPGYFPQQDVFEREVALLIRDAASGKPLYEARASNDGTTDGGDRMLAAMFDASMREFPNSNEKPHDVVVDLTLVPPAPPMPPAAPASAP